MAFPRLNAFTYWTYLLSGILLYVSPFMGQSPNAGWYAFAPFTLVMYSPGRGMDFYNLALILLTISTTGGAINFIVTILRLRAPGMAISKMPLFLYSTLTASVVTIFGLPGLTAANLFLELNRRWHFHFFDSAHLGHPLLWQQLFWFFGHPWVYIIFLPATGMISMIVPTFSRRPIVGYAYVAAATVLTGLAGFGVWVHHMFATGMSTLTMSFFAAASMTIALFTIVQVFAWLATLWRGWPVLSTAMHFALGFIALIVVGGLSGVATAVIPVDWQITETYWLVAHIHYVLVGANLFPVLAALYYWAPKMTGRMMNEKLGKWSFWLAFAGFNCAFFPMHFLGFGGMPRRVYTYLAAAGWGTTNFAITIGAFILAIGLLLTLLNFLISRKWGPLAGENPWNADSLEWATSSPPAPYGSVHIPVVMTRHPNWDEHEEEEDPGGERILDDGRMTLMTSWLDAQPQAVVRMPADSIYPLIAALTISLACGVFVFQQFWMGVSAIIATGILVAIWLWPKHPKEADELAA